MTLAEQDVAVALSLSHIDKQFDGKAALSGASFEVRWGEVHALLGENGAGKSTLMNVASGLYAPDAGAIEVDGAPAEIRSPGDATAAGIGMVHQHYKLIKRFSVAENILLACGRPLGISTVAEAARLIEQKAPGFGLQVDASRLVGELSIAEQQRVELLKVLLQGARIVILDEPTAVLTDQEAENVLGIVRKMSASGTAVVLISHKLREVTAFSDRVTVMRHGRTIVTGQKTSETTRDSLARAMVGAETGQVRRETGQLGDVLLKVEELTAADASGKGGTKHVSFSVRSGEILGVAGVGGNGQAQLADALMGLASIESGRIEIGGAPVGEQTVTALRGLGMRFVPADRYASGLFGDMSLYENYCSTRVGSGAYGGWFRMQRGDMRRDTDAAIERHDIRGGNAGSVTQLLSGGNAQKLLLARELGEDAKIIVAHSPTRGLDVRACSAVHQLIVDAVGRGAACVLISEDLEEILALSTTIAVMSRGEIVGIGDRDEMNREKIGTMMLGHA